MAASRKWNLSSSGQTPIPVKIGIKCLYNILALQFPVAIAAMIDWETYASVYYRSPLWHLSELVKLPEV
jgi:hypothetical protein